MKLHTVFFSVLILMAGLSSAQAQEEPATPANPAAPVETPPTGETVPEDSPSTTEQVEETVKETGDYLNEQTEEIRKQLDESEDAQKVSAGILQPIYSMAEYLSFSWFHWIAFAFMVSGVVSFALQLVLGKLVVLMRGGFSLGEILTDAQGLVISLVGLFLTTQAAAENSAFTSSAASVITSTLLGLIAGFLFYLWGQSAEIQALKGRRVEQAQGKR